MQKHKIIIKKKNTLTNENADDIMVLENNKCQRRTERGECYEIMEKKSVDGWFCLCGGGCHHCGCI